MSRVPPGQNRKQMTAESGLALDLNDARYDVTQWRKDIKTKLTNATTVVGIVDMGGNRVHVDSAVGALSVIEHEHHMIHEGDRYFSSNAVVLGSEGTKDYLIVAPASPATAHLSYEFDSTTTVRLDLYKATSVSDNGTALSTINRNQSFTDTSLLSLYEDPAVTGVGTLLGSTYISSNKCMEEILLQPATTYLVRITEMTSNSAFMSALFDWYEFATEAATYVEVVDTDAIVFVDSDGNPFVMQE